MSAVEYTKCDGADCGRVTPEEPGSPYMEHGWARLSIAGVGEYDLCPDCARKAMEAVGVEEER